MGGGIDDADYVEVVRLPPVDAEDVDVAFDGLSLRDGAEHRIHPPEDSAAVREKLRQVFLIEGALWERAAGVFDLVGIDEGVRGCGALPAPPFGVLGVQAELVQLVEVVEPLRGAEDPSIPPQVGERRANGVSPDELELGDHRGLINRHSFVLATASCIRGVHGPHLERPTRDEVESVFLLGLAAWRHNRQHCLLDGPPVVGHDLVGRAEPRGREAMQRGLDDAVKADDVLAPSATTAQDVEPRAVGGGVIEDQALVGVRAPEVDADGSRDE